jgi:RNA polymerase sigma-70 factor (ECF subfamily)
LTTGKARWPDVAVTAEQLGRFLASRPDALATEPVLADDLFLACACLEGDTAALAHFDALYLAQIPAFISRVDSSPDTAADVRQLIAVRFLVGDGERPPRIVEYNGRSSLGSWLRVAAVHLALDLVRARQRVPSDEDAADDLVASSDPELEYIRANYGQAFRGAFSDALAALQPRWRTVLRLHFVDGLTIERIAELYDAHRVSVSRWVSAAREWLADETRRLLKERLELSPTEFDSLFRLVHSQLDISLRKLLGTSPTAGRSAAGPADGA